MDDNKSLEIPPEIKNIPEEVLDKAYSDEKVQESILNYITGETNAIPQLSRKNVKRFEEIKDILSPFNEWTLIDERVFKIMASKEVWYWQKIEKDSRYEMGFHEEFFEWIRHEIYSGRDDGLFQKLLPYFNEMNIKEEQLVRHCLTETHACLIDDDKKPTSIGTYLLNQYPKHFILMLEITNGYIYEDSLFELLINNKLSEVEKHIPELLKKEPNKKGVIHAPNYALELLFKINASKYEQYLLPAFEKTNCEQCRANMARLMTEYFGGKYKDTTFKVAKDTLKMISEQKNADPSYYFPYCIGERHRDGTPQFIEWLAKTYKTDAKDIILEYVDNTKILDINVIEKAARYIKQDAVDIIGEALNMKLNNNLKNHYQRVYAMLAPLDFSKYHEKIWKLVICEFDKIRDVSARALAKLGDGVFDKAKELMLKGKKVEERDGGMRILIYLNTDKSRLILENDSVS